MTLNDSQFFQGYTAEGDTLAEASSNNKQEFNFLLTNEAKELLIEASNDEHGNIIRIDYVGGFDINTNNKEFVNEHTPRTIALWDASLNELEGFDLVRPLGYKREIFEVTHLGYRVADKLKEEMRTT